MSTYEEMSDLPPRQLTNRELDVAGRQALAMTLAKNGPLCIDVEMRAEMGRYELISWVDKCGTAWLHGIEGS
jgi:hypothetical protein